MQQLQLPLQPIHKEIIVHRLKLQILQVHKVKIFLKILKIVLFNQILANKLQIVV